VTITVAICTWNRSELLRRCLSALCEMRAPRNTAWEVLVVNNNCTDATSDVVRQFARQLPLREAHEPSPGLSNARNRAISEAQDGFICWIDDDILVDEAWLCAYEEAMAEWPDDGIFGGPIEPVFEGVPPAWLEGALPVVGGVFGIMSPQAGRIEPDGARVPFGGNMVIRTDLLRRRPFDPRLGRTAGNMMAGEEGVMIRDLLGEGVTGHWVPGARVCQIIPPRMQTIQHIRRYFHDWGVSLAQIDPPTGRLLFGRPLWMWRQAIQHEVLYRVGRLTSSPEQWTENLRLASMAWGGLRRRPAKIPRHLTAPAR
jgi:hypothetical protein